MHENYKFQITNHKQTIIPNDRNYPTQSERLYGTSPVKSFGFRRANIDDKKLLFWSL
jgi:hypothetical protein